jgi:RNA polymerase sigma-70 factor (ECF subfamily)
MLALADDTEMPGRSGADEAVLNEELLIAVRMISEHLSPKQKAVFVLRDMQGLTMEEMENILSMSPGKVKSSSFRPLDHQIKASHASPVDRCLP